MTYAKLLMLVVFLLALISFGSRLQAKPKYRERVKDKPRVQKIKKKKPKKPKKRYQRKKRQPKYQLKRRKKRGFISPKIYKKQQRERRRKLKQKKAIPKRKLRINKSKPTTNNNKKIQMNKNKVNINKKGRVKKQCDKLCQHRMRHIQQLLRLGLDTTDSGTLRLTSPFNKRNKIKKRGN